MTPDADTDRRRLVHMLEAIASIQEYASDRATYDGSVLVRSHVAMQLQVIGEAANRLRPSTQARHSDVPWKDIVGIRHRIVHDYDSIDLDIVWRIVRIELEPLRGRLEAILVDIQEELHNHG